MSFLLIVSGWMVAMAATLWPAPPVSRSDVLLVRAVISGDTIEVASVGRVRLLGIRAPALGRGFDASATLGYAARDKLTDLVLHHWVRLEADDPGRDVSRRHVAYVVREDGVCVNTVLVREGLARVTARGPLTRLDEFRQAEAEAQALRKGIWRDAPPEQRPGYTRPKSKSSNKRRSSWPLFRSSTRQPARFANATSSTIGSITGRSGSSSSSSRPGR